MFSFCRPSALAISLIGLTAALPLSCFGQKTHRPHNPHQLSRELKKIRGRKGELKAELKETRQKTRAVKEDIVTVDSRIVEVKDRLDLTRTHLSIAKQEKEKATASFLATRLALAKSREQVRRRIKRIYMDGSESALSALSGTHSAGDVASHDFLMRSIEKKDRDIFNRFIALQRQVQQEKKRRDEAYLSVANLEDSQEKQTRDLSETRQEKAKLLGALVKKQSDLEASMKQFEVDEERIASEIERYARMARAKGNTTSSSGSLGKFNGAFSRPVNAPITGVFGSRFHPILHRTRMHYGVDFGASYGTPIHAAADGVVIFSSFMRGYGHVVILAHGGGYSTVYAHTSSVFCSDGQHVRRGQVIAAVGMTGLATGPHLHFELRLNGQAINPLGHL